MGRAVPQAPGVREQGTGPGGSVNRNDIVDRRELAVIAANADRQLARRTPEQKGKLVAAMNEAFAKLDRNGDGHVTRTEFQQANRTS